MYPGENAVMPLVVPPLLQCNRTVVEDVEEGLDLTTEGT